jgi:hypothetical protein
LGLPEFQVVAQPQDLSRHPQAIQVIARFLLRTIILVVFASFASIGFGRGFAALLGMSILLSAVIGALKRERPFGTALNHWDEMLAYAALFALVSTVNHAVPV